MAKFKIGQFLAKTYGEIAQSNPLRWIILYKEDDGSFTPQTGQIKCKDFFNDLVGKYYNTSGQIYGFDTSTIKVNDDGVYFLLKNVKSEWFEKNLISLVYPELEKAFKDCPLEVHKQDEDSYIVRFDRVLFNSTYYISLLSFLLRVSSMEYEHTSIEDVFKNPKNPCRTKEAGITDPTGNIVKWGFNLPEAAKKYWFYSAPALNSETHKDIAKTYISLLHNNGIMTWANNWKEVV